MSRQEYEKTLEQSNRGLRSWAARQAAQTSEQHEATYLQQRAQSRRKAEERKREADAEHERQKQWALNTSAVEKTEINAITRGFPSRFSTSELRP